MFVTRMFMVILSALLLLQVASARDTVLVAGGTGRSGQEIIKVLQQAGYHVKATTRDVARAQTVLGSEVEWVEVDFLDPLATATALRGVNVVVSALGHGDMVGSDSPQFVHNLAVRHLIDSATAEKVQHFVLMSSSTAGHQADHRKEPRFGFVLHWMTKSEDQLIDSGVPYTIIGPGGLVSGEVDSMGARLLPRSEYRRAMVSRRSVADAVLAAITTPGAKGKAVALVADPTAKPGQLTGSYDAIKAELR